MSAQLIAALGFAARLVLILVRVPITTSMTLVGVGGTAWIAGCPLALATLKQSPFECASACTPYSLAWSSERGTGRNCSAREQPPGRWPQLLPARPAPWRTVRRPYSQGRAFSRTRRPQSDAPAWGAGHAPGPPGGDAAWARVQRRGDGAWPGWHGGAGSPRSRGSLAGLPRRSPPRLCPAVCVQSVLLGGFNQRFARHPALANKRLSGAGYRPQM